MAKLYFRYGAMNSGKSTNLLQTAYNYDERGMNPFLLKPSVDTKGDNCIISRIGSKRYINKWVDPTDNLFTMIQETPLTIDCVLVDEVQFLKPIQIDQLLDVATRLNIPVICYGLRTDFQMTGFDGSRRLLEIAHSIEELKTICRCGKKAIFNMRFVNGEPVFKGESVMIDDQTDVTYESMCAACAYDHKKRSN